MIDSRDGLIYPLQVYVIGDASRVVNPNALTAADGSVTTINARGAGKPQLMLDLGTEAGGRIEIGITKGDGTSVRLAYSEQRDQMTDRGDEKFPGLGYDDEPDARFDLVPTKDALDYVVPGIRGGERWILVQLEGAGSVSIDYIRVRENHYRPKVQDYVGHFLSNDDLINRIWYASAYTFNLDSAQDEKRGGNMVAMDGAKRDRLVWTGDLGIEAGVAYYTTPGAARIMHDSIYMFACQQDDTGYIPMASQIHFTCADQITPEGPPDDPDEIRTLALGRLGEYTAWWLIDVAKHYQYTGDAAYAQKLLPAMRRTMTYFDAQSKQGLYSTGDNPVEINWHPFDKAAGEDTHTNAVWYRAMKSLAELEREVGDGEQAALQLDQKAAALQQAMMATLWDKRAGAFILNSRDPRKNHAQDGNVEAVYAGVIDSAEADSALEYLRKHLSNPFGTLSGEFDNDPYMTQIVSPFISADEVFAYFRRFDGAHAMNLLRRLWGHMADTDPNVTVWEKLAVDGTPLFPSNSLAHGWAAGAVEALSANVLGMRPTQPGYTQWIVEPQPVDLQWAQGQTYTPQGVLVSRWQRGHDDSYFRLTLIGPAGSTGSVAIPTLGQVRDIAMDGHLVWRSSQPVGGAAAQQVGDYVVFQNVAGEHTYAWSQ